MHYRVICRILGILLMIFSISMLPPTAISLLYNDESGAGKAFATGFLITLITGFIIWIPVYKVRQDLQIRDGFLITVLFWGVLSIFGAIPFMLTPHPHLTFVDAVFESISGLTTTGATVITGIDYLPKSILFYRQELQWMGGMGIIVLAVAILPMLGIGGMQLYRTETPGPIKDSKLTPRITETAKSLWYIYISLTIFCGIAYWLAGMDIFDAISHSFSTVATGGFSTHDASIGYFDSLTIEIIASFFMIVSAVNFSLHFFTWKNRATSLKHYLQDSEFVFYISILLCIILISTTALSITQTYSEGESLRKSLFMAVSITTTTGFATDNFSTWPSMLPFLLFVAAFVGGCASSTSGGMKAIRILLILKQGYREILRLIHPNAIIPIKIGKSPISSRVLEAVWGFFSVYLIVFVIMLIILLATGLDQVTAWSAIGATLNNLGPGLGSVAVHFGDINEPAKWVLCFSMLLGRLEVFTLLVLFTPAFWRR